jgi:hypothetical protein
MVLQVFGLLDLRDLPVLAEAALEIASGGSDGVRGATREKMIKRFFFDGVDVLCDEFPVRMGEQHPSPVFPDAANAALTLGDQTIVIAQIARDLSVFQLLVEEGFLQHLPPFVFGTDNES